MTRLTSLVLASALAATLSTAAFAQSTQPSARPNPNGTTAPPQTSDQSTTSTSTTGTAPVAPNTPTGAGHNDSSGNNKK